MSTFSPKSARPEDSVSDVEARAIVALHVADQQQEICGCALSVEAVAEALDLSPAEANEYLQRERVCTDRRSGAIVSPTAAATAGTLSGQDVLALGLGVFLLKGLVALVFLLCVIAGVFLAHLFGAWVSVAGVASILAFFAWAAVPRSNHRSSTRRSPASHGDSEPR